MAARAARLERAKWLLKPDAKLVPLDPDAARRELSELADAAEDLPRLAALLSGEGAAQDFLAAAFDLSDFLRDAARRRPEMLDRLFDQTVSERLEAIAAEIGTASGAESETALMAALRQLKLEAHFLIALADRCAG
jgi:glutamate-ammonia-ligase adenylyltransferase